MAINIKAHEKDFLFALVKEGVSLASLEKRKLTKNDVQKIIKKQFSAFFQEDTDLLPENLKEKMGAFVSYFIEKPLSPQNAFSEKMLRGCIGMLVAQIPLWETIVDMTYKAAREDTRFKPINEAELPFISYDITLLEPLSLCPDPSKIELGKHGIMLQAKGRQAVFLPHVPTEQNWNLEQTFEQLCYKAGLPKDTWKDKETIFYWYEGLLLHP